MPHNMPELGNRPRSSKSRDRWRWIFTAIITFWVIVAVWIIGYAGRVDLRKAILEQCITARDTNHSVAQSWRAAAISDQAIADVPGVLDAEVRKLRAISAKRHRKTALVLEEAARINCAKINPPASLLP